MPIEFREVRRGEIGDALAFAAANGGGGDRATLVSNLSLAAINARRVTLGLALHQQDPDGRRRIVIHLATDANPGLARLLIDRALRKAEAADVATMDVQVRAAEAAQSLWSDADWLSRLYPTSADTAAASEAEPQAEIEPLADAA